MRTGKANQKGLSSRRGPGTRSRDRCEDLPGSENSGWKLPSGEALMEFALNAGFVAPSLLDSDDDVDAEAARSTERRRTESPEPDVTVPAGGGR